LTPTSIETVSGRFVDLVNPDPSTIVISDIAWAISRMPRYVGHTVSAIPYTIGQHSIYVAELVQRVFAKDAPHGLRQSLFTFIDEKSADQLRDAAYELLKKLASPTLLLECLMHDASEAYIVDVPTPLKQADGFKQVYLHLEAVMMTAIREAFGMQTLSPVHELFLRWADQVALTIEAYHLIRSRGANWTRLLPLGMSELQIFTQPKEPIVVYEEFLGYYEELTLHAPRGL